MTKTKNIKRDFITDVKNKHKKGSGVAQKSNIYIFIYIYTIYIILHKEIAQEIILTLVYRITFFCHQIKMQLQLTKKNYTSKFLTNIDPNKILKKMLAGLTQSHIFKILHCMNSKYNLNLKCYKNTSGYGTQ